MGGRLPRDAAVSLRARRVRVGDSEGQEGLGQDRHSGRNGGVGRLPRDAAVSLRPRRVRVRDSAGQERLGQDRHSGRNGGVVVGGGWATRDAAVSLRARWVRVGDSAGQEGLGQDRHSGRNGGVVGGWVGYPVMLRSAFALGGFGSGIARDKKDLVKIATQVGMGGGSATP